MEVNIDPSDIEQHLAQAILNSTIGSIVRDQIKEKLSDWKLNTSIQQAVNKAVEDCILKVLMHDHKDKIEAAVRSFITDEVVKETITVAWDVLVQAGREQALTPYNLQIRKIIGYTTPGRGILRLINQRCRAARQPRSITLPRKSQWRFLSRRRVSICRLARDRFHPLTPKSAGVISPPDLGLSRRRIRKRSGSSRCT